MNDGDWICSDANCGNINFARRLTCYRCNKEKPNGGKPSAKKLGTEIGKSAAEKSRGLFNADDWQCNKCANVNWARRQTCNVCNAPKFGEVEARTGYGGGYNERGVVEYRRRESSSSDEFDEFGRRKRKRRSDDDKVGITEGPENKKLPPTMLQKETKMGPFMPAPAPNVKLQNKNESEKVNGSVSDGSVCELPRLNKIAFRRNQINYKQEHSIPSYNKANGVQRKRFSSIGDKDQTGSSGYETGSKKGKNDSPNTKLYNPVMENRVSSTNNDVVYKFTGSTPAEDFEVTYTIEERVRAAAFAIVYNNCKISTDKFESLYDKPAPDFKTIFSWRQRLLSTGCLVDLHLEIPKKDAEKSLTSKIVRKKITHKLPNPDEIAIISDSDDNGLDNSEVSQPAFPLRLKSISAETLLLPGVDNETRRPGGSVSTLDGRGSQGRSHSELTHRRTRSSSCDSQDSNYPDSDIEPADKNILKKKNLPLKPTRQSVQNSDSESVSYNSDEVDFRSRVFGDMRKVRRKPKKHSTPIGQAKYIQNEANSFQGYSTVKPMDQSPLATGNIYTTNFHNMNVSQKVQDNNSIDTDAYSSEYVPTRLAATAKKNYQDFKNNVKKKGFWAKGNSNSYPKQQPIANSKIPQKQQVVTQTVNKYFSENQVQPLNSEQPPELNKVEDFTKDEFDSCVSVDQYLPFDKPLEPTLRELKTPENTSRIFDVLQSNSVNKNRSIMDIFNSNEQTQDLERPKDVEKFECLRKTYETEWDEDDDALYQNSDALDIPLPQKSSPQNRVSIRTQSPMTNMLYATSPDVPKTVKSSQPVNTDIFQDKRDMLFGLLQNFNDNQEKQSNKLVSLQDCKSNLEDQIDLPENTSQVFPKGYIPIKQVNFSEIPEPIPRALSDEIMCISTESKNKINKTSKVISPSKKVHVLESITIKANNHIEVPNISRKIEQQSTQRSNTPTASPKINLPPAPLPPQSPGLSVGNTPQKQTNAELDLSNLLSGINTNTLLLALQNLQQLQQNTSINQEDTSQENETFSNQKESVETINLTNDEEWEKESNQDESIERQLEKLDGNTGDTPFLSDIFDPGPVVMPANVANKLSLNLKKDEVKKSQTNLNENAPVIGNFKSFALPKPILLNRLKLTVKQQEKINKQEEKRLRRRKKKPSASQEEGAGGDEEESGDEADLSKYDLWGSDEEQGNSSKMDNENQKEDENSKDDSLDAVEKNGKSETKSKKRSRSSSSSSTSSSSSSSSHSSSQAPKNRFDDFNLNSERESQAGSPRSRKSRSRSPRARPGVASAPPARRKSRDSRSAGETRGHENRDKEKSRERERRERSRGSRERKERRYSREGATHYSARGRHR